MNQTIQYYGVDVTKDTLHISYQTGSDQKGQAQWAYHKVPDSQVIFERTGTYSARLGWVLALLDKAFSILTPAQSKGFSTSLKSISKTDRSDAILLARYGQVFQPQPSQLADESLHQLRQQHKHPHRRPGQ